jgi:hypothetical protein
VSLTETHVSYSVPGDGIELGNVSGHFWPYEVVTVMRCVARAAQNKGIVLLEAVVDLLRCKSALELALAVSLTAWPEAREAKPAIRVYAACHTNVLEVMVLSAVRGAQ